MRWEPIAIWVIRVVLREMDRRLPEPDFQPFRFDLLSEAEKDALREVAKRIQAQGEQGSEHVIVPS